MTPDFPFLSIRALGELLRSGQISVVALTEAYLDRLESTGPQLGALVTSARQRALAQAERVQGELRTGKDRGPLHGIPFGVKDLLATRGIPTTYGAEMYRTQVFDYDATVIERLEARGAVLLGKLSMVELAGGFGYTNPDASFTGPTKNPWNRAYWSGGSSSGSAAATASGLVSFSLGSETSGSLLTPAAFCGLTGLRPTYGLVSRFGAMPLCWTLDRLGPLSRSADDCALVLEAIAGPDPRDPTTGAFFREEKEAPKRPFRIGVVKDGTRTAEPEVAKNFEASLKILEEVGTLERDIAFPDLPYDQTLAIIVAAEAASAFRGLIESGEVGRLRSAADRIGGYAMMMTLAVDYLDALRARRRMEVALAEYLGPYDAVVAPMRLSVAPLLGADFTKLVSAEEGPRPPSLIAAGSLTGLPALCVPNGLGASGLPTSLQFLGAAHSDARLLALGKAFQGASDFHTLRPSEVALPPRAGATQPNP